MVLVLLGFITVSVFTSTQIPSALAIHHASRLLGGGDCCFIASRSATSLSQGACSHCLNDLSCSSCTTSVVYCYAMWCAVLSHQWPPSGLRQLAATVKGEVVSPGAAWTCLNQRVAFGTASRSAWCSWGYWPHEHSHMLKRRTGGMGTGGWHVKSVRTIVLRSTI